MLACFLSDVGERARPRVNSVKLHSRTGWDGQNKDVNDWMTNPAVKHHTSSWCICGSSLSAAMESSCWHVSSSFLFGFSQRCSHGIRNVLKPHGAGTTFPWSSFFSSSDIDELFALKRELGLKHLWPNTRVAAETSLLLTSVRYRESFLWLFHVWLLLTSPGG